MARYEVRVKCNTREEADELANEIEMVCDCDYDIVQLSKIDLESEE